MSNTKDTLELVKAARQNPSDELAKAAGYLQSGSAVSGLTAYDLEAPAKSLFPVLTPLRNRIARVSGKGGIQANWRAITGINTTGVMAGVAQGQRGAAVSHATADYLAAYRGAGLEDFVNFEAEYSAEGFDDVKARAVENLLRAVMIQEEFMDLGGNTSVPLGTTPTPVLADVTTGGSLGQTQTINVGCVALTLAGYQQLMGWNNGVTGQTLSLATAALVAVVSRTNMDGTVDQVAGGVARKSALASVTTATDGLATHRVTATVTPVAGAVAYAWYAGTAGNEVLAGVTSVNSFNFAATSTGTQNISALPAADNSADGLVYDGLLTQIMKSNSGAYFKDLPTGVAGVGSSLTSDGAAGIVEVDAAFADFWNQYRLSPDEMFVPAGVLLHMNKLVIANGGAPLIRYNIDAAANGGQIQAGVVLGSYLNKITGQYVKLTVHPNMPAGMIMFWSNSVPYPLSGVANIVQKRLRRDYYQMEWALRTRRYEYGVYFDGVLQNYFPPAFGIIRNIAA